MHIPNLLLHLIKKYPLNDSTYRSNMFMFLPVALHESLKIWKILYRTIHTPPMMETCWKLTCILYNNILQCPFNKPKPLPMHILVFFLVKFQWYPSQERPYLKPLMAKTTMRVQDMMHLLPRHTEQIFLPHKIVQFLSDLTSLNHALI